MNKFKINIKNSANDRTCLRNSVNRRYFSTKRWYPPEFCSEIPGTFLFFRLPMHLCRRKVWNESSVRAVFNYYICFFCTLAPLFFFCYTFPSSGDFLTNFLLVNFDSIFCQLFCSSFLLSFRLCWFIFHQQKRAVVFQTISGNTMANWCGRVSDWKNTFTYVPSGQWTGCTCRSTFARPVDT